VGLQETKYKIYEIRIRIRTFPNHTVGNVSRDVTLIKFNEPTSKKASVVNFILLHTGVKLLQTNEMIKRFQMVIMLL
jgi:hypothetical protein